MIKQLRVTIRPAEHMGDVVCLEWEVTVPDQIIGYKKMLSGQVIEKSNDFKSQWDWMWETAKREIEKYQANPVGLKQETP